jgi:hypothetical protein
MTGRVPKEVFAFDLTQRIKWLDCPSSLQGIFLLTKKLQKFIPVIFCNNISFNFAEKCIKVCTVIDLVKMPDQLSDIVISFFIVIVVQF